MRERKEHVNLDNARHKDQREIMETIIADDVCPFCIESLRKYHKQPILSEGEHWILTPNQWPYKYTKSHHLLIAKAHIESITDLPTEAFSELGIMTKQLVESDTMIHGALTMRFGDTRYTGSSVRHLHAHIIESSREIPDGEKVSFKVSR